MQWFPIRNLHLFAMLTLWLAVAGACNDDKAAKPGAASAAPVPAAPAASATFSCTKPGNWCTDYSGDALVLGESALKGACGAMSGKFASGTCSTANVIGSCNVGKGQVKTYYRSETNTAENVKSDCDLLDGKYAAAP